MRATKTSAVARIFLFAVASLFLFPHYVNGTTHKYVEDFSTTLYKDADHTTANWDTVAGELRLFPFAPTLLGTYDTPGSAYAVTVSGDYAFVADLTSGLQVIDISDPTNPTLLGICDTPGQAFGVTVSGDYAFVGDGSSGLQVIDISDPTNPTLLGTYDTPGSARGIMVRGDYAFVADYTSGLQVIDISDPTNPTLLGTYDTPDYALNVTVSGDCAFVADYTSGLLVIDISDPTNPTLLGTYDTPGYAYSVSVRGDYAFVADRASGLQVIDISDPTDPTLLGTCDTPGETRDVTVSGDYAFVADWGSGLQVIDISDPTNPSLLGTYDTPGNAWCVTVSGDYASVADEASGLQLIDIADPTSPTLLGTYNTPGNATGVTVSGDYAFVADDYLGGLQVIDISDPTSPTLLGTYNTPGLAWGVTISGDYAFVADGNSGLQVIDISDPTNPTLLGTYDTPGFARGIMVRGDYAFVGDGSGGLQVIDISDPSVPTFLGTYNTPGDAIGVTVRGDYAFLADGGSGLQVIDISDPTNPTLLGTYDTPGEAGGVTVSGDYAFVADGGSGLQVIIVFQREVDSDNNVGRSLFVNASNDTIFFARLTTTQTNSVHWELSADGGVSWQDITPDGNLNELTVPGIDLIWRSTHALAAPGVNPGVTHLEIYWFYESADIDSIWDIPNDQGRQVSISWQRSGYDYPGSSAPITEYAIYRKIDYDLTLSSELSELESAGTSKISETGDTRSLLSYPPGDWHFIMTVPSRCEDTYAVVVPTLADSTITDGMYYTTFFVSAMTETPGVYFDSDPDSGYSVDNIAPGVPTGLMVAYNTGSGTELLWEGCPDADFQYFCIYRSDEENFEPSPENLVHMTASASWTDPVDEGWQYTYKITAVDCNGNESDAASATTVTGDETPSTPKAFALHQNIPNPFNPATVIRFDLPRAAHVGLHIYDVSGRLVCTLADKEMEPGSKEIAWDGRDDAGRGTASGVYFYRLTASSFTETRKMVLLK